MLYIVSTPIGNLKDISLRATEVLKEADVILAEDSRVTRKLLDFLGIKGKKIDPYYEQIEKHRLVVVENYLKQNLKVVLVSDAGTPLISDPGYTVASMCRYKGYPMTVIPGASAAINALVLSGAPIDKFVFLGFLPKKKGKRIKLLGQFEPQLTKVVYESPLRLSGLLEDLLEVYGESCVVSVNREMTKRYEESIWGGVKELIEQYRDKKIKGEITVVFFNHKGFKT